MHYANGCDINILIMYVLNNVPLLASKQLPPDCMPAIPAPAPVIIILAHGYKVFFVSLKFK